MRRFLLLPVILLNACGSDNPGLSISLPPGETTIAESRPFQGIYGASFVGGDGLAAVFWSSAGQDGSLRLFGQSVGFDLEVAERYPVSNEGRSAQMPSACRHANGMAISWTDMPITLPNGVTLNESDVAATMSWPPAGEVQIVNPNVIGQQSPSAIACLAGGARVVAWKNVCVAVERTGLGLFYFEPEECEDEPAHGSYLRFLDADGNPSSAAIPVGYEIFPPPLLAAAGGDRFVVLTGARLQSWKGDRLVEEIVESEAWSERAELTCVGSRCVTVVGGQALVFDATHLSSNRLVVFQESSSPSPNELIHPRDAHLACDSAKTCVVTWVINHEITYQDYVETVTLGVYAAALDLERGTFGPTVLVREPAFDEYGALVAATSPGRFLLASVLDEDFEVRQLAVD